MKKSVKISQIKTGLEPIAVPEGMQISELMDHFVKKPTMRHIYVVNSSNEFQGVIDRKKIFSIMFPELFEIPGRLSELYSNLSATTAGDLYRANAVTASVDDSVEDVARKMLAQELFEIPVLDKNRHPVKTLTIWDLLRYADRSLSAYPDIK